MIQDDGDFVDNGEFEQDSRDIRELALIDSECDMIYYLLTIRPETMNERKLYFILDVLDDKFSLFNMPNINILIHASYWFFIKYIKFIHKLHPISRQLIKQLIGDVTLNMDIILDFPPVHSISDIKYLFISYLSKLPGVDIINGKVTVNQFRFPRSAELNAAISHISERTPKSYICRLINEFTNGRSDMYDTTQILDTIEHISDDSLEDIDPDIVRSPYLAEQIKAYQTLQQLPNKFGKKSKRKNKKM